MNLTKEMVSGKVKQMLNYSRDNFGLPNGDDFPELAKIVSESEDLSQMAVLHFLMVCIAQPEFNQKYLAEKKAPDILACVQKHGAFKSYLDAIYLGYTLGKQSAEIEMLDRLEVKDGTDLAQ